MLMYWPKDRNRPTRNFGDALNPIIGKFFSGKEIKNINGIENTLFKNEKVYLVCGSSLTFIKVPSIIWRKGIY